MGKRTYTRIQKERPARRWVVAVCFGCGALIGDQERNMVSLFWGDGDPGQDEIVEAARETVVRMCRHCREKIVDRGGFEFLLGGMAVCLTHDATADKSKTGAHGILRTNVVRRMVKV